MKIFRHKATGEEMTIQEGQSALKVLEASPSWEEIKPQAEPAPEPGEPPKPAKKPAKKPPAKKAKK